MNQLQFGPPLGRAKCKLCGVGMTYHTMDQLLAGGLSGIGGPPDTCQRCADIRTALEDELGPALEHMCPDCGWSRYEDDYDGPEPKPGRLPSGNPCPTCKGKGVLGTITEAKFEKMLKERIKA